MRRQIRHGAVKASRIQIRMQCRCPTLDKSCTLHDSHVHSRQMAQVCFNTLEACRCGLTAAPQATGLSLFQCKEVTRWSF